MQLVLDKSAVMHIIMHMNKSTMHTRKLERQLSSLKDEAESLPLRRRELMFRLREAGFTYQKIADIYMCRRQYVEQEVSAYREHDVTVAA